MYPEKRETSERADIQGSRFREEVFSKVVRAGKRTYFFDVKTTRSNEYYLTITESKKKPGKDGSALYEKHKIFLYKEDFEKFSEGLADILKYIDENQPIDADYSDENEIVAEYSNVDFDDLSR